MSSATQNMIFSPNYQAGTASVLAQLTNCFYSPAQNVSPFSAIGNEIGFQQKIYSNWQVMQCGYFIGIFPNQQVVLVFSGIQNYRQALAYNDTANQTPAGSSLGGAVVGAVNIWLKNMAAAMFPGIISDIRQYVPGATDVVVGGHSMGGCLGDCFAAVCRQNPSLNLNVQSLYKFGSPKTGNATFANGVNISGLNFLFRLNDDPIPFFPDERNGAVVVTYNADGSIANGSQTTTSYYHAGIQCQLASDGSYVPGQNFRRVTGEDQTAIISSFMSTGTLPVNHGSDKHYEAFQQAWNNQRRQPAKIIRRNREVLEDLPTFSPLPEVVASGADLPSVPANSALPTPATGQTQVRVPNTIVPRSVAGIVLPATGPKKPRVRNGDGRAHRKALRVIQDLNYLQMHDAKVANMSTRYGTQYLTNPLFWTGDVAASYADVLTHLQKITNK